MNDTKSYIQECKNCQYSVSIYDTVVTLNKLSKWFNNIYKYMTTKVFNQKTMMNLLRTGKNLKDANAGQV